MFYCFAAATMDLNQCQMHRTQAHVPQYAANVPPHGQAQWPGCTVSASHSPEPSPTAAWRSCRRSWPPVPPAWLAAPTWAMQGGLSLNANSRGWPHPQPWPMHTHIDCANPCQCLYTSTSCPTQRAFDILFTVPTLTFLSDKRGRRQPKGAGKPRCSNARWVSAPQRGPLV